MVTAASYDEFYGYDDEPKPPRPTRRYVVTLTSDDERVTHEVEWSQETAAAVSALCKAVNAQATWSATPRMYLNSLDSAAPRGEVA